MQNKPVIIGIRYSVLLKKAESWILGRNNTFEAYRDKLFADQRLLERFIIFKNVVIPSIIGQSSPDNIYVIIITSSELPQKHLMNLIDYTRQFQNIMVMFNDVDAQIDHDSPLDKILKKECVNDLYAHIRLDDDDALSIDFVQRLREYIVEPNIGRGISFGLGYGGIYDTKSRRYKEFRDLYYIKLGCGMAIINRFDVNTGIYASPIRTAYGLGNHNKIDLQVPIIVDSRMPSFIYSIYPEQDTSGHMLRTCKERVLTEKVKKIFNLSDTVYPD